MDRCGARGYVEPMSDRDSDFAELVVIGLPCDECGGEGELPSRAGTQTACWLCSGEGETRDALTLAEFRDTHRAIGQPRPRRVAGN